MTESQGYWIATAEYDDGTCIEKYFPYNEHGNYLLENERQYEIEYWLLDRHPGCVFYSVAYTEYKPDD